MQRQPLADYEFWFVVGSQFLYGKETLDQVAAHAQIMVQRMNASGLLPCKLVYKATVKTPEEIFFLSSVSRRPTTMMHVPAL